MTKQSKITASNEKPLKTESPSISPPFHIDEPMNDDIASLRSEKQLSPAKHTPAQELTPK